MLRPPIPSWVDHASKERPLRYLRPATGADAAHAPALPHGAVRARDTDRVGPAPGRTSAKASNGEHGTVTWSRREVSRRRTTRNTGYRSSTSSGSSWALSARSTTVRKIAGLRDPYGAAHPNKQETNFIKL